MCSCRLNKSELQSGNVPSAHVILSHHSMWSQRPPCTSTHSHKESPSSLWARLKTQHRALRHMALKRPD